MFESQERPNIIWFFVDQMRYHAMSHAGDPNVSTPHLDRFAAEGVSFPYAVSGTPLCSPFRGSLLTGQYPHTSSVPALNSPMDTKKRTVAHAFRDEGYQTCWIGKWHLDGDRDELDLTLEHNKKNRRQIPPDRRGGFQDWFGYENNNQPFNCVVHTDDGVGMKSYRLNGYETDALTDHAISWITERCTSAESAPFFMTVSVQPPHNPYVAPAECMARYNPGKIALRENVPPVDHITARARTDLAGYYAAIDRIDWNFGRLRDSLQSFGLDQNTYILFFSDHGDLLGSHGQFRKQSPLEESIRIPFIVGGPTRSTINTLVRNAPINHVDIGPTTLGLCGIETPSEMQGFNYAPLLFAENVEDFNTPDSAYISLPVSTASQSSVRKEESVDRPFRGIVTVDRWKYVVIEHQPLFLFDLEKDPYEYVNLAHNIKYKNIRSRLHARLQRWVQETGDKFSLPT